MPSLFTKIIQGEIPCYKIFEDEHTFAFLDIKPHNLGHTLLVPKIEVDYFIDLEEPYYSAIFLNAKKLAKAIHRATGCKRVGTIIHGWAVPHFHYHLVPMFQIDDLEGHNALERDPESMKLIQEKILDCLKQVC